MNMNDLKLAHVLRLKFGLAPQSPTNYELELIKRDIKELLNQGTIPTYNDWLTILNRYCKDVGKYFYGGVDNSDLITLLKLANGETYES